MCVTDSIVIITLDASLVCLHFFIALCHLVSRSEECELQKVMNMHIVTKYPFGGDCILGAS